MSADFSIRPARRDDLEAVIELFNEQSRRLHGTVEDTAEEILQYWESPDVDFERDVIVAEAADGTLAGYGDLGEWGGSIWLDIRGFDPEPQEALLQALEELADAKKAGAKKMGYATEKDAVLRELYGRSGYRLARHSYRMRIALDGLRPEPEWPSGITVRVMSDDEERLFYEVHEDSFEDTWMHTKTPYEEWVHWFVNDPFFDPSLWFVAEAGDEAAGVAICRPSAEDGLGWVRVLGVRRAYRRRGIGQALLQHAFAEFARRGFDRVGLGVDAESPTGAVGVYERAGMHVERTNLQFEKVQG